MQALKHAIPSDHKNTLTKEKYQHSIFFFILENLITTIFISHWRTMPQWLYWLNWLASKTLEMECPGRGYLGKIFAGYVPLASQHPYPMIVNFWFVCCHLKTPSQSLLGIIVYFQSILWLILDPILVTFGQIIFLLSKSQKRATLFQSLY